MRAKLAHFLSQIGPPAQALLLQPTRGPATLCPMPSVRRLSLAEQTATQLRADLLSGRWGGQLPGVLRLAQESGVSRQTLRAALHLLEAEGLLASDGHGRSRRVAAPLQSTATRQLRIGFLLRERLADEDPDQQTLILEILRAMEAQGHTGFIARKSLKELKDHLPRILRQMQETQADGWIVLSGSPELLRWCSTSPVPCLALGGACLGLPLASVGSLSLPAYLKAVDHLIELGHRRIVLLTPRHWHRPSNQFVRQFQAALARHGIAPSDYNAPHWEESPQGMEALLTEMFRMTPPTAFLLLKSKWSVGLLSFLARRGLRVPEDVSVISWSCDSQLAWHCPPRSHFSRNQNLLVRRISRWAAALAKGRPDREALTIPVTFVPGHTVAPAAPSA